MKVKTTSVEHYCGKVYNFGTKNNHNYFVKDVLAHNCYRGCTKKGKHADIMNTKFFSYLHPYTELALGGGNVLSHPDLDKFLTRCKEQKLIPSITINQIHFEKSFDRIKKFVEDKLIYGVGISVMSPTDEMIEKIKQIPNAVIHLIAGVTPSITFDKLSNKGLKILILGYKDCGRGIDYLEDNMESVYGKIDWLSSNLDKILKNNCFDVVSFDNLALNQLRVKDHLTEEEWKSLYMGDDGVDGELTSASMYVDLVGKTFARNSFSDTKYDMNNIEDPNEMFRMLRGDKDV